MTTFKLFLCRVLAVLLVFSVIPRARASAYDAHPKLVVIVVIDQFRADYLDRYRSDFKGKGFRLFLDHGAYFEDCYYDYANTKTAPGHATLGTGAYTDGHGISSNAWWDLTRNKERPVSSVEDERYHLVGIADAKAGERRRFAAQSARLDHRRFAAFGDPGPVPGIRHLAQGPRGHSSRRLLGQWRLLDRSRFRGLYYLQLLHVRPSRLGYSLQHQRPHRSGRARGWLVRSRTSSMTASDAPQPPIPMSSTLPAPSSAAKISAMHSATDLLIISLSANDILGHQVGPDSPEERAMVDSLDQQLDSFFTWLDKNIPGGLPSVWIALSADHGVAPVPATAAQLGIPAATIDLDQAHREPERCDECKVLAGRKDTVPAAQSRAALPRAQPPIL